LLELVVSHIGNSNERSMLNELPRNVT
jgi:hypothetical protein